MEPDYSPETNKSGVPTLLSALVLVGLAVFMLASGTQGMTFPALILGGVGLFVGVLGCQDLAKTTSEIVADPTFDKVRLAVDDSVLSAGDTARAELDLKPSGPLSILSIRVRLISWEAVTELRQSATTTQRLPEDKRVDHYDEPQPIRDHEDLRSALAEGRSASSVADIELPTDPEAYFGETGPLDWEVRLEIELLEARDVHEKKSLTVDHREL